MRKYLIVIIMILSLVGCTPNNDISIDTSKNDIKIIKMSKDTLSTVNLTLIDEYSVDFDNDNTEEKIELYTAAERNSDGVMMWDDGQKFALIVKDNEGEFVLFNGYVQLGKIDLYVYTPEENEFHIATLQTDSASMTMVDYTFDKDKGYFKENVIFNPSNINLMHTSNY